MNEALIWLIAPQLCILLWAVTIIVCIMLIDSIYDIIERRKRDV